MSAITQDLASILQGVRRPGDFHAAGRLDIFTPQLEVTGVGPVALPLLPAQAEQLVATAEAAPYGRGADTLIDRNVRRTWQIGADRVHIGGRHWAKSLATIVARSATGLGVLEPVAAELYKMLIYDTGSFFVRHRDTEKAPGMFATLVIVLPSLHTGGELLIRHRDREVCLDLACEDASEVAFAAFYADCWHEVRPISSGYRLVLIYNLIRQDPGKPPEPPAYDTEEDRVSDLLSRWAADLAATQRGTRGDCPEKLVYPLEHAYTPAEIGFATLKNADAAVALVLVATARRANCELHLARLAIEESGSAEYCYSGSSSRHGRYSELEDEDFEVGEIFERSLTLSEWQTPDGDRPELADLPFSDEELCPPDALDDEKPDDQQFFEATGNAGASFERSYHRAAFVLWPSAGKLEVIAAAGSEVFLPYLAGLARHWAESGDGQASVEWQQAHRLARLVIDDDANWPIPGWPSTSSKGKSAGLLASLNRLQDSQNLALSLARLTARGHYDSGDNEALADAASLLPPGQATELIEPIIARNAPNQPSACAELLERIAARFSAGPTASRCEALLKPAATALLAALPGDPALPRPPEAWPRPFALTPELAVDLLTALRHLAALPLGERAVDLLLAWPDTFAVDDILVPAALRLAEPGGEARDWAPTRRLIAACLDHLDQRIAEPLVPSADFTRASRITCRCRDCAELSAFLADPMRKVWTFKAAETHRSHVETSIRKHDCDLDLQTDRRGRPYTLVCTKNQASHMRRVAQRKRDLENRARLAMPPAA
ncbi:MAG: 2OG-Fe(II) oxygenase [Candidatus Accumulibacter sp.]|uniref:2OG-Fe(II) oxygenase n=1 Tax=Accumulibacter sp. TaxID=2053492 RepID=UPI001A5F0452|nr:2OG-Fe(II) oxygenase [Accumulibacter sp.]MBL8395464.1 2OG-Fe(II) oxygenase [Accumulibacter sp.]